MGEAGPQLPQVGHRTRPHLCERSDDVTSLSRDGLSRDDLVDDLLDDDYMSRGQQEEDDNQREDAAGDASPSSFRLDGSPTHLGGKESSFHRLLLEIAAEHQRALADVRMEFERTARVAELSAPEPDFGQTWSSPLATPTSLANQGPRPTMFASMGSLAEVRGGTRKRTSPMDFGFASSVTDYQDPSRPNYTSRVSFPLDQNVIKKVVRHQAFDLCSSIFIILNSALYGWAANTSVQAAVLGRNADNAWFRVAFGCFTAWFVLEIAMRMFANGVRTHLFGEAWAWNWFDLIVVGGDVLLGLAEVVATSIDNHSVSVVRMLRILRITRAVRVVRLVRFFRELRMMVFSILRSGSALLWSAVLLGTTIYIFAVYFIQITALHLEEDEENRLAAGGVLEHDQDHPGLREMFGSLLRAEYTLYKAVAGLNNWEMVSAELRHIDGFHEAVFCFFTFFTTLTMLNIITGIFVESAISSARSTQEEVAQDHMHATAELRQEMEKIFRNADADSSGCVSISEFEMCLQRREVKAYLQTLGIETDKARALFKLLDVDKSGEITLEEFTFGCLRLKGGAKSIDLATLMQQTRRMDAQWRRFFSWTESQFRWLHDFEERVERRLAILDAGP